MRIVSWNVNGIRAVCKKGFLKWLVSSKADIVCVQETKAHALQFPDDIRNAKGYEFYSSSAEKKGYSGTAVWTKNKPLSVSTLTGKKGFDAEGRLINLTFKDFNLLNVYFPNGGASEERLRFKLGFYDNFLELLNKQAKQRKGIIICGDFNTAHKEIDLARPKENQRVSGFLPVERQWIDKLISAGFIDTFRMFNQAGGNYSWWDYKTASRERNTGWRIDYFFVNEVLKKKVKKAFICPDVFGSDHCPVGIDIDL
jgi:exodeoxyribonuclease III